MGSDETTGWYSDETATFGDRIAGARDAAGMTQKDLAKRLGIKLGTLRNWEDDLNEPRANKLQMLSGLLNVSLPWLLTGQGDGPDGPEEEVTLPSDVSSLLSEIRKVRTEIDALGDRLALLEKRLRTALKDPA